MMELVIFDIQNNRARRIVTKLLRKRGARIHRSVFLCDIESNERKVLASAIEEVIDLKKDSVRFYPQCEQDLQKMVKIGNFQFEELGQCLDDEPIRII